MGMELYFWVGTDANMHEKQKGLEVAVGIKNDDRMSKPNLFYPREVHGEVEDKFWSLIDGGKPETIKPAVIVGAGDDMLSPFAEYKFYEIDEHKNYVPEEIEIRPLTAEMLKDDMSFILRTQSVCYVWSGKNASTNEKRYAVSIA